MLKFTSYEAEAVDICGVACSCGTTAITLPAKAAGLDSDVDAAFAGTASAGTCVNIVNCYY